MGKIRGAVPFMYKREERERKEKEGGMEGREGGEGRVVSCNKKELQ